MDRLFEAIAHAQRREILRLLKRAGEMPAGDIADRSHLAKPTLSHHLNILVTAGLLDRERRGQFIFYRVNLSMFEDLSEQLAELFAVERRRRR
jgi:ArsR family transcriptional regulator, arsenate/arsenite/antimonite-responsive transcriptional repressor